jgi:hypothetical protein
MLRLALRNYSVFLTECFLFGNKIILVEREGLVFSSKLVWVLKHQVFFLMLGVFCLIVCFKRCVKTCRERDNAQKPLNCWSDAFGKSDPKSAHGCFGRPKVWYGCSPKLNLLAKWEYEIVSKRVSELPFFFSTYAFVRTFENEQISSNVCFFGWVSLTRLKFNTSFFWSYKTVIGFNLTCNESSNWFDVQVCS